MIDPATPPSLTDLDVTGSEDGRTYAATWDTSHLAGGETVSLWLSRDNAQDAGVLLVAGLDATAGKYVGTLPESVAAGTYYLRAVLSKSDTNYHSRYSASTLAVTDPYQPAPPATLSVSPAGNGTLSATWAAVPQADGYVLQALDASGNPLAGVGTVEAAASETSAVIGGVLHAPATPDNPDPQPFGLIPGQSYKLSVAAYRQVGSIRHYSDPLLSDAVALPVPHPAQLTVRVAPGEGADLSPQTDSDGSELYLTNQTAVQLTVSADQALVYSIMQYRVRSALRADSDALITPGGRPSAAPTARSVLDMLATIQTIILHLPAGRLQRQLYSWNPNVPRLLQLLRVPIEAYTMVRSP